MCRDFFSSSVAVASADPTEKPDLALLREKVQRRSAAAPMRPIQRHLLEGIDQRRGEPQFAAVSLGGRIDAEKPKTFTKRLGKHWNA